MNYNNISCDKLVLYRNGAQAFTAQALSYPDSNIQLPDGTVDGSIMVMSSDSGVHDPDAESIISIDRHSTWEERFMIGKRVTVGRRVSSRVSSGISSSSSTTMQTHEHTGVVKSWKRIHGGARWACTLEDVDGKLRAIAYFDPVDYFILYDIPVTELLSSEPVVNVFVYPTVATAALPLRRVRTQFLFTDMTAVFQYRLELQAAPSTACRLVRKVVITNASSHTAFHCVVTQLKISAGEVRFPRSGSAALRSESLSSSAPRSEMAMMSRSSRGAGVGDASGGSQTDGYDERRFHSIEGGMAELQSVLMAFRPLSTMVLMLSDPLNAHYHMVYVLRVPMNTELKSTAAKEKVVLENMTEAFPQGTVNVYRQQTPTIGDRSDFLFIGHDRLRKYVMSDEGRYHYRITTVDRYTPIRVASKIIQNTVPLTELQLQLSNDDVVMHAVELRFHVGARQQPQVFREGVEKHHYEFSRLLITWDLTTSEEAFNVETSLPNVKWKFYLPKRNVEHPIVKATLQFVFEKVITREPMSYSE